MNSEITRVKSISQLNSIFGFGKPTHPLIQIIDVSKWAIGQDIVGKKFSCDLYSIALKDKSCGLQYGRNHYDFDEGVLIFTAPNQITFNPPILLDDVRLSCDT